MVTRDEARSILHDLYTSMPRSFYSELDAMQRGISFVLDYLERAEKEVIAGELAKKMNVSTARIAALLKTMEQSGFILRRTSSKDARQTVVEITPAGIDSLKERKELMLSRVELLLTKVSKEELYTYISISRQIKEALSQ